MRKDEEMQNEHKFQIRVVRSTDPQEFENEVNEFLAGLPDTRFEPQIKLDYQDGEFIAMISHRELFRKCETIRDQYALRGETHTCGECTYLRRVNDKRVKHLECGAGQKWRTMTTEEACNLFYEELEKGAE